MAIFPVSPTVGQEETVLGRTFVYDGDGWVAKDTSGHTFEDSTGNALPTRNITKAGEGIEFEDDAVGEKTVVRVDDSVSTKPDSFTENHIKTFDEDGNDKDSGIDITQLNTNSFVQLSSSSLLSSLANAELKHNQYYFANDVGIYVKAISSDKLSPTCIRKMKVPATYAAGLDSNGNVWNGIWNPYITPAIGSLCIHCNHVYKNLTGSLGTETIDTANNIIELDNVNWEHIPMDAYSNNEYIDHLFECTFNWETGRVIKQWDEFGNVVTQSIYALGVLGSTFSIDYTLYCDWTSYTDPLKQSGLYSGVQVFDSIFGSNFGSVFYNISTSALYPEGIQRNIFIYMINCISCTIYNNTGIPTSNFLDLAGAGECIESAISNNTGAFRVNSCTSCTITNNTFGSSLTDKTYIASNFDVRISNNSINDGSIQSNTGTYIAGNTLDTTQIKNNIIHTISECNMVTASISENINKSLQISYCQGSGIIRYNSCFNIYATDLNGFNITYMNSDYNSVGGTNLQTPRVLTANITKTLSNDVA